MAWSDGTDVDYEDWKGSDPDEDALRCTRLRSSSNFRWQDVDCTKNNEYICRTGEYTFKVTNLCVFNISLVPS